MIKKQTIYGDGIMLEAATLTLENVKAIYLNADNLRLAVSILYQAYHDDVLFRDIFQWNKEGYEARLRSAIKEELNAHWFANHSIVGLFDDERLLAVTCVVTPNSSYEPGRFWHWRLKMLLTAGFLSTRHLVEKEKRIKQHIPSNYCHMISFIGVHPDHQNHGLGHILMGAIDSIVEEDPESEGVGVYATVKENQRFLEHGNYTFVKEIEIGNVSGKLMFKPRVSSR